MHNKTPGNEIHGLILIAVLREGKVNPYSIEPSQSDFPNHLLGQLITN